jgi:hypothetical protein
VKLRQVIGQGSALGWREDVADVAKELHDAFGCLISQLQVGFACGLERGPVDGRLGQALDGLGMCGFQLRVHGQQVADCLMHEGADFGLLRIGCVYLDIEVLEDVVDVRGHFFRACRAVHHHAVVPAARAHCGCYGADAADDCGTRDECEHGLSVDEGTQDGAA